MKWEKAIIKDIAIVKKGSYITKKEAKVGPYPVILGGKEPAYYIDKYNHQGKAIVISRSGASAGYVSFWDEDIFITDGFLVEPIDAISYEYLYYLLKSKQDVLQNLQGGSAIPHVTPTIIYNIDFELPPAEVRERIGKVLRDYDDLIENNQKQIKLLEEAAQRLYKEWFVDLRFPGHESVEIVDGLPSGWERRKLSELCETVGGGTPSTKEASYYTNGKLLWVTPTDITKNNSIVLLDTEKKITEEGLKNSSAKMLPEETILMTSRASVGYFGICEYKVCTNQGFISCVPNHTDLQMYLLYNLMDRVEEIRQKAGGSTYLEISKKTFRDFDVVKPDVEVLKKFQEIEYNILKQIRVIAKKIVALQEARDRLLPKLMSGEVEV